MPSRQRLEQVWTVLDLIRWGTEYFTKREIESPRLTIELLLCHVLNTTRVKLYSGFERPLLPEELTTLRELVQRRAHHEPLQYITGSAWFYSLEFAVSPDVLIPRPETEILVHEVIKWAKKRSSAPIRGLDIGTGSGCIPISIAHHVPNSLWRGIDRSAAALDVARGNAVRHGLSDRCEWDRMDILKEVPQGAFDVVTMNPPYIPSKEVPTLDPEVRDFEPHLALTDDADGLTFYRRLLEIQAELLVPGGLLFMELGWQGADRVRTLFDGMGTITMINDLQDIPRIVVIQSV